MSYQKFISEALRSYKSSQPNTPYNYQGGINTQLAGDNVVSGTGYGNKLNLPSNAWDSLIGGRYNVINRNDVFQAGLHANYPNSPFIQQDWSPPTSPVSGINPPSSPYLSALSEYMQNMPTTNTWDWEGGEASPYGIRTPGLGWAWHYDETGNPVPNNPNTQIGLRGGRY